MLNNVKDNHRDTQRKTALLHKHTQTRRLQHIYYPHGLLHENELQVTCSYFLDTFFPRQWSGIILKLARYFSSGPFCGVESESRWLSLYSKWLTAGRLVLCMWLFENHCGSSRQLFLPVDKLEPYQPLSHVDSSIHILRSSSMYCFCFRHDATPCCDRLEFQNKMCVVRWMSQSRDTRDWAGTVWRTYSTYIHTYMKMNNR